MGGGLVGFNIEQTFMAQKYERGGRDGRVGGVGGPHDFSVSSPLGTYPNFFFGRQVEGTILNLSYSLSFFCVFLCLKVIGGVEPESMWRSQSLCGEPESMWGARVYVEEPESMWWPMRF